jgi:hypothetical protein
MATMLANDCGEVVGIDPAIGAAEEGLFIHPRIDAVRDAAGGSAGPPSLSLNLPGWLR